jgi:hypothetical protein
VKFLILLTGSAATLFDLRQFRAGKIEPPGRHIAFPEIFARIDVFRIDVQGLLIEANAEIDLAELAMAVPR